MDPDLVKNIIKTVVVVVVIAGIVFAVVRVIKNRRGSLVGDSSLSPWFILYYFLLGLFAGEILPVWLQTLGGVDSHSAGAKATMFESWSQDLPKILIYAVLAVVLYFLFKKLHWLYVGAIGVVLGLIVEFLIARPQEANGPNIVDNPIGSLPMLIVVWLVLTLAPYGLYKLVGYLAHKKD